MTCIRHSMLDCADCGRPQAASMRSDAISQILLSRGPTMAKPTALRRALRGSSADLAGQYLHKHGPQTTRAVFAITGVGRKLSEKRQSLQAAIRSGWLIENAAGDIDISDFARAHYDEVAGQPKVEPVGQIAAVRTQPDVFARPPLSKRFIPNPRGTRQDIPAWSVRSGASFKTVAGG